MQELSSEMEKLKRELDQKDVELTYLKNRYYSALTSMTSCAPPKTQFKTTVSAPTLESDEIRVKKIWLSDDVYIDKEGFHKSP